MSYEKISIIGASGFVGSSLSSRIKSSPNELIMADIKLIDENCKFVDVRDFSSLEILRGSDCIINLAAEHRDDVKPIEKYSQVNILGAENVCKIARKHSINKIIFTSSVAIYGFAPPGTDETGDANYFNEYGRTKHEAESVYREWYSEDPENRCLVIIRPTVIFGEGNRGNVFNLLRQVADNRFVMFGDGSNKKSMAYVENVSAFIEHSISLRAGLHIYNYVDQPDLDMNTLISVARKTLFDRSGVGMRLPKNFGIFIGYIFDLISKLTGRSLPISSIRVKKFLSTTQFSSRVYETGFKPLVSLEEGLIRTLKYEFKEDNSEKRIFHTE